jgi:hypothetical protein
MSISVIEPVENLYPFTDFNRWYYRIHFKIIDTKRSVIALLVAVGHQGVIHKNGVTERLGIQTHETQRTH